MTDRHLTTYQPTFLPAYPTDPLTQPHYLVINIPTFLPTYLPACLTTHFPAFSIYILNYLPKYAIICYMLL